MGSDHDIHVLNGLIETVIDSEDGYRKAGEAAENPRFKTVFLERSRVRVELAHKLQAEVRRLGGSPEEHGTLLAKAHRTFLDLKDKVSGHNDKAVIDEVERGEDFIKGKFNTACRDTELSAQTLQVVESGRAEVQAQHDDMSALKSSMV